MRDPFDADRALGYIIAGGLVMAMWGVIEGLKWLWHWIF